MPPSLFTSQGEPGEACTLEFGPDTEQTVPQDFFAKARNPGNSGNPLSIYNIRAGAQLMQPLVTPLRNHLLRVEEKGTACAYPVYNGAWNGVLQPYAIQSLYTRLSLEQELTTPNYEVLATANLLREFMQREEADLLFATSPQRLDTRWPQPSHPLLRSHAKGYQGVLAQMLAFGSPTPKRDRRRSYKHDVRWVMISQMQNGAEPDLVLLSPENVLDEYGLIDTVERYGCSLGLDLQVSFTQLLPRDHALVLQTRLKEPIELPLPYSDGTRTIPAPITYRYLFDYLELVYVPLEPSRLLEIRLYGVPCLHLPQHQAWLQARD